MMIFKYIGSTDINYPRHLFVPQVNVDSLTIHILGAHHLLSINIYSTHRKVVLLDFLLGFSQGKSQNLINERKIVHFWKTLIQDNYWPI